MENFVSHMMGQKMAERYADYPTSHDQHFYYSYEPPSHGYTPSKHHSSGGEHKSKAAMSALTLLAFLFFLHILQQCIKDHITAMSTSPIMIMSSGKEGNDNFGKTRLKLDKTARIEAVTDKSEVSDDKEKHLTKISTYHPFRNVNKYSEKYDFSKFVNAMDDE